MTYSVQQHYGRWALVVTSPAAIRWRGNETQLIEETVTAAGVRRRIYYVGGLIESREDGGGWRYTFELTGEHEDNTDQRLRQLEGLVTTPDGSATLGQIQGDLVALREDVRELGEDITELGDGGGSTTPGPAGQDGATFIPSVNEAGDMSWENDKGLPNPLTVNVSGQDGHTPVFTIGDNGHWVIDGEDTGATAMTDDLRAKVDTHTAAIQQINTDLGNKAGVTAVEAMQGKVSELEGAAAGSAADIEGLQTTAARLEAGVENARADATANSQAINALQTGKADKSDIPVMKTASATLTASSWTGSAAPFALTVNVSGIPANAMGDYDVAASATAAQVMAFAEAVIWMKANSAGSITLNAANVKPTVNIPIVVRWW